MKWLLIAGAAGAVLAVGLAVALTRFASGDSERVRPVPYRGSRPPVRIVMPNFTLRDESGDLVRDSEFRGNVVLVTFLDSQCSESCPIIASTVARGLRLLAARDRGEVVAVAISTDPSEDTRASVLVFLRKNQALGKIRYLGGGEPLARLRPIWRRFQILSSHESGTDTLHSAPVRVYDRDQIWVSTLHVGVDLTPANVAHDARLALSRS